MSAPVWQPGFGFARGAWTLGPRDYDRRRQHEHADDLRDQIDDDARADQYDRDKEERA